MASGDSGEPFTLTHNGHFSLGYFAPGTYTVAQELPAGWMQTTPTDGAGMPINPAVVLADGGASAHITFGNSADGANDNVFQQ